MSVITNFVNAVKNLWATEPTRVIAAVTGAVVFVAANFGLVVQEASVTTAVAALLVILLGGEVTRSKVTPAK